MNLFSVLLTQYKHHYGEFIWNIFLLFFLPFGSIFYLSSFFRLLFEELGFLSNFLSPAVGLFNVKSCDNGFKFERGLDSYAGSSFTLYFLFFLKFPPPKLYFFGLI